MFENIVYYTVSFLAQRPTVPVDEVGIPDVSDTDLINGILGAVYFLAGAVAVISMIMGGIWYITADGDPSKVQRGKNAIIYSSIGLIFVLLAFGITGFISGRFVSQP